MIWQRLRLCPVIYLLIWIAQGIHYRDDEVDHIYVQVGHNVTIQCREVVDAKTVHRIEWWKEDKKIVDIQGEHKSTWEAASHVSILPNTYTLYFRRVRTEDSGEYSCAVNGKRRKDGVVKLFVQDVPDPPGMPLMMGFTSRSANLSWAPSGNNHYSPIKYYVIFLRVGEKGQWDLRKGIKTPNNHTRFQVTNLEPFTVYSFRVVAVNAIGGSEPSKESYYMVTLREVPDGRPTIASAYNVSSTSIRLQWAPPPESTIHGEFLGYRITFRPRDKPEEEKVITIRDPTVRGYTIRNLATFTQYIVSVQVFNPEGDGPPTSVAVMTDEGIPSAPLNLTVVRVTDSSIRLRWHQPERPNGVVRGYKVYYLHMARNLTETRKTTDLRRDMEFVLANLNPYTQYKIWIKAYTWKTEGDSSRIIDVRTDVQGPSAPNIVNLTCQSLDSLFLQWERPQTFYRNIDYYLVYYRSEDSWEFQELIMTAPEDRIDHAMFIPNLTANTLYEVKVRGVTHSIIENSKAYKGQFSTSRKVVLQNKCPSFTGSPYTDTTVSAGMVAGVMCASFALLLAIISFILWRKYFQAAYYYLDDPPGNRASPQLSETFEDSEYASIPISQWSKHVADLHADGDIGFSREYEMIQQSVDLDLSSEYSQMIENKNKNRYVNIVAYDHSRVILKSVPGQKKSADYINANYIDGYNKSRAYIGTQGPLPSTFDDYWRMIWEQRVYIMIMITNLVERGRHEPSTSDLDDSRKCDMYWPKEGIETYGIIQVRLIGELNMATYILRTFIIRNSKIRKKQGAERTVYQYHYTNWPDHGVPDHPLPVLSFVRKSSAANPPFGGPIIVHCSAGVGRTGTYIVLDAMLKQIQQRQSVNVFGFLKHIRQQRNYLVQTEEQYIFIHDALLEAIESGDTEINCGHLSQYIQNLTSSESNLNSGDKNSLTLLERQFKLLTSFKARDFNVVSALKPCNKMKNRSLNLIPIESSRVHITPKPGTDGSDYINATFFQGFTKLREFIITQYPLQETIGDFWQMVWDHNSQTVVLMCAVVEKDYPCFWPENDAEMDYGHFKVKMVEENIQECVTTRDFILQSNQDEYEVTCRIIQCPGWPEAFTPTNQIFDLVRIVQDWHLEYQNGPMIVVDRFGGTDAATFCCLTTVYKQLGYENCLDVYMYAKLYHVRRPGIWRTQDDILFLYKAIETIITPPECGDADTSYNNQSNNGHVNSNGHVVKVNTNV
ncbi:tyrosine-protein phosphatase 99A-like isoform X4 [Centruroides vittatus]|uniref:tyrosine-protein phosphatase 99A-like isoform X4 n=1 Tax=Centruroides vittatus TaxID=120091 RepID=UPI00350EF944